MLIQIFASTVSDEQLEGVLKAIENEYTLFEQASPFVPENIVVQVLVTRDLEPAVKTVAVLGRLQYQIDQVDDLIGKGLQVQGKIVYTPFVPL